MNWTLRGVIAVFMLVFMLGIGSDGRVVAFEPQASPEATPQAPEFPKFNIRPVGDYDNPWFDVTIAAGDGVQLTAAVKNFGNVAAVLRTYSTNAHTAVNGGFSAGTEDEAPEGATRWIEYSNETFESDPGTLREFDFTISVPADTPPGEYFTALVVQTADPLPIPGTDTFTQTLRSAVSVEITVPGAMTAGFELSEPVVSATGGQWTIDLPITNTGTSRLRPTGEVVVSDSSGTRLSSTHVEMGSVYGGSTTSVRVVLPEQLPLGTYFVSAELIDEATGTSANIEDAPIILSEPEVAEAAVFTVEHASVSPNDDPVQYVDVSAIIINNAETIPTATVTLLVLRNGQEIERYPLAQNQALPQGRTDFDQRYVPIDGWQPGIYTFEFIVSAVSGNTETILATIDVPDEIVIE